MSDLEIWTAEGQSIMISAKDLPVSTGMDTFYKALYHALEGNNQMDSFLEALSLDVVLPVLCRDGRQYVNVSCEAFGRLMRSAMWLIHSHEEHSFKTRVRITNVQFEADLEREVASLCRYMSLSGFEVAMFPQGHAPSCMPLNGIAISVTCEQPYTYGWYDKDCMHHAVDPKGPAEPAIVDIASHVTAVFSAPDAFELAAELMLLYKSNDDQVLRDAVSKCTSLRRATQQARAKEDEFRRENEEAVDKLSELRNQLADTFTAVATLRIQVQTLDGEKKSLALKKRDASASVKATEKELSAAEKRLVVARRKVAEQTGIAKETEQTLHDLVRLNDDLEQRLSNEKARTAKLEKHMSDEKSHGDTLLAAIAKEDKSIQQLRKQLSVMQNETQALHQELATQEVRSNAAQKRLTDALRTVESNEASAKHILDSAAQHLRNLANGLDRSIRTALKISDPQDQGCRP